jgi:acyl carrier protein
MLEKIRSKMAEAFNLEPETVLPDSSLKDDLGLDSLDLYELVVALEDEYGIQLPEEELMEIVTVEDIIDMLQRHDIDE